MKTYKFLITILLAIILTPRAAYAAMPNEAGEIMILMYHGLTNDRPKEDYMQSVYQFKSDLQKLYDNGYRLISMADYLDNNITVEAGCTPVILTFDDGYNTAFSLIEKDGELIPRPDCAVDIINKFSEKHPDFGRAGVFFICDLEGRIPFNGAGTIAERFQYLIDNGYELGNHTASHVMLNNCNLERIMEEMGRVEELVKNTVPGYNMRCMAYPYGSIPKTEYIEAVLSGTYKDITYQYDIALRERQNKNSSLPTNDNFDPLHVPRVRPTYNATKDLGWFLNYYKENPMERYISDGDPDTMTISIDYVDKINLWKTMDKFLKFY